MIVYQSGLLGLRNILRVDGSPVFKVILPTLFSTIVVVLVEIVDTALDNERSVRHPYNVGVFIGAFSLLLTFRLNFAYQRYWEAATNVHLMLSKWLDVSMTLAAWHYQSHAYDDKKIKPPAFGSDPRATPDAWSDRPHALAPSFETTRAVLLLDESEQDYTSWYSLFRSKRNKMNELERMQLANKKRDLKRGEFSVHATVPTAKSINYSEKSAGNAGNGGGATTTAIPIPSRFRDQRQLKMVDENKELSPPPRRLANEKNSRASVQRSMKLSRSTAHTMKPSLFLQELAHLSSLLSAVALSTLRQDNEMAEAPLTEYIPGQPWPPMDPTTAPKGMPGDYTTESHAWRIIYFILGLSRSEKNRTVYNAARPFTVLGGVSDQEIMCLQNARGPAAKTSLCFMWLQEFISRETLHGSVGDIHPAIQSRLFQYQSDGMVGYHQARKIAYVPFPFVNAQIIAFFSLAIIFIFPLLYHSFVTKVWLACLVNFLTVLCFLGLHEVARELENPYINVPNELPLCTFQAYFNEALGTMFSGYHPDSWFTIEEVETSKED